MKEFLGYVYFIGCKVNGYVKIGLTKDNDVSKRIASVQVGCPFPLELFGKIRCVGVKAEIVEKDLHNVFKVYRKNGEWFSFQGFLAAFIIDYFSDEKEVGAYGVDPRKGQTLVRSWKMGGLKNEPINKAIKAYKAKSPERSVISGLEAMLAESMKYVAELEATLEAYYKLSERQQNILDTLPSKRAGTASDGYTIGLIASNYGEKAKLDEARLLADEYDWEGFFENGELSMPTPDDFT